MAFVKFFRRPGRNLAKSYQPGSMLSLAPTKGLLNEPGQNSCFLNSAVQVLWHLDIFRRSLRQIPNHYCLGDACIFCALKSIFSQFQHSRERALASDSLRHALAETFKDEQRFQLGFMDDAAECFENILERIHLHIVSVETDSCTAPTCITHQKFAMTLYEQAVCRSCGASSDPLPFTELVHYVSTTALCQQAYERREDGVRSDGARSDAMFGELLQAASTIGDLRNCPSNCGQRIKMRRVLMNSPEIVTIGFVWDSEQSDLTDDVTKALGPHLNLSALFYQVMDDATKTSTLLLVGMICFSSRHYCAFTYHTKSAKWVFFDDATVKEVGSRWKDVVSKCIKGHFQPLLLFYSSPDGGAVVSDELAQQRPNQQKNPANGDATDVPAGGLKRLELTRENVSSLLSAHGTLKHKNPFSRNNQHTSAGRGPVKMPSDPRSRLRELAQKAGELRNANIAKKDSQRGEYKERALSRSLSPPADGFRQHMEQRLYSSQGRGPTRAEPRIHTHTHESRSHSYEPRSHTPEARSHTHESRTHTHEPRSHSHEPRSHTHEPRPHTHDSRSHSNARLPLPHSSSSSSSSSGGAGHQSRRAEHANANGYDTDSSQDSRGRRGYAYSSSRPPRTWRPMREALNVDSVLSEPHQSLASPRPRPANQERLQEHEQTRRREERRSLMTIYEDERRPQLGSHTSLDSALDDRPAPHNCPQVCTERQMQRTESGYESSDRLSNGSASLDSPGPDTHTREPQRRSEDSKADLLHAAFTYGLPSHDLQPSPSLFRQRAFRYTPRGVGCEEGVCVNGSSVSPHSVPPRLPKTSSSEGTSSDELTAPPSEMEHAPRRHANANASHRLDDTPTLVPGHACSSSSSSSSSLHRSLAPPTLPKPRSLSPALHRPNRNGRWAESTTDPRPLASDGSSHSDSSDGDGEGPNASPLPNPAPGMPNSTPSVHSPASNRAMPTTYFSVDACMTDTYRAKYHKRRPALPFMADAQGEGLDSSGEEPEYGDEASTAPIDMQPSNHHRDNAEAGYTSSRAAAKWNPISFKGLDEHGFL
ncbi:hypothetical protein ACEWY4_025170 [Coilia grayii]|uniref:USP domain-containing protein n=1 Tax=Coilia grayii TaxID=363190 RepID=A0ABD1IYK1_9TELE